MTIIGAMYASVLFLGINNCATVQPVIAVERRVFYRERAAGMYSVFPYAMGQVRGYLKIGKWFFFKSLFKIFYFLVSRNTKWINSLD